MLRKMRKFIAIIAFAFVALGVQAQNDFVADLDTLAASETGTYTMSSTVKNLCSCYFHVAGLKISGNTGGTISYQYANDVSGTNWHTMATDTITDGTTDASYEVSNFAANRARITVVANGTTQSGSYRASITCKRQ